MRARLLSLVLAAAFCATPAFAQVPNVLPYQGYLADQEGLPVNGAVQMTFRLYAGSDDAEAVWEEVWQGVQVEVGVFAVMLGAQQEFPPGFTAGTIRYLGVEVDDDGEATPRQSIGSVPYALYAGDARYLRGQSPDDFFTADDLAAQGYATTEEVEGLIAEAVGAIEPGLNEAAVQEVVDEAIAEANQGVDAAAVQAIVEEALAGQNYLTADDLNGYVTAADLDARGYITAAALEGYVTDAELAAALEGYVTDAELAAAIAASEAATQDEIDFAVNQARTAAAQDLAAAVAALEAQIAQVGNGVQAQGAFILGRSAQTSNGAFAFNGQFGIRAAHEMCQASFANEGTAHMCTPDEVVRAVSANALDANNRGAIDQQETWTVAQATNGNGSNRNSCQNLLYNSGDVANGSTLTVDFDYVSNGGGGNLTGNIVDVRQNRACNLNLPVLCCR